MNFFKAYDMRGEFGKDFTPDDVYRIGLALPQVVKGRRWLVGRDVRLSSEAVHAALVAGLSAAGTEVTDLGLSTTSMVYFFTGEDDFDGSVMVTASHNPPADNGLKVSKRTALPVSYSTGLDQVEALVSTMNVAAPAFDKSASRDSEFSLYHARYLRYLQTKLAEHPLGKLKFAVDCSNGMASLFAKELFPTAVFLNDTMDGRFPAHSPNPLKADSRAQIAALVREKELDCGVIFDGDADRAMFVDERGEFVQPDYLIPLIAKPGEKTIHDVRTSRGTIETLREMGCEPVMVPVGAALAKPILRELGAFSGGELAGHYYFSEFHCCDSGLLAAIRILQKIDAAHAEGGTFSELVRPIVSRYANSGERNFKVEDKDKAIERVLKVAAVLAEETGRTTIDGIRLEYADGWISVRKSNTEPYLRLLVEHRSAETLREWIQKLEEAINDR